MTKFLAVCILASVVAACSNATNSQNEPSTRNATIQQIVYKSNGDGTAQSCDANLAGGTCPFPYRLRKLNESLIRKRFAKYTLSPTVVVPSKSIFDEIARIAAIAGAAPVIARLPVAFSPAETGIAQRNGVSSSEAVWEGSKLSHQSNDPAIASATLALASRLTKFSGYATRTIDTGLLVGALNSNSSPKKSGRKISTTQAFAQLGSIPFVRAYLSPSEVTSLLAEKLIAGVEIETITSVSDDDSSGAIGLTGLSSRDPEYGNWLPHLQNPPKGSGTYIAISDGGIAANHPAFRGFTGRSRVVRGACFSVTDSLCDTTANVSIASGGPCESDWDCWHGTHVAGIAAGRATTLADGSDVPAGVAPLAKIFSYRTCQDEVTPGNGRADCITTSAIQAMGDVGTQISLGRNVVSFNMSHGLDDTTSLKTAIATLAAADVIVIQANGNGSRTNFVQIATDGLYVVANMTNSWQPAANTDFSSEHTDLWAPGTSIIAAKHVVGSNPVEYTVGRASGTSMAAPHVAGAAALIDESLRRVATRNQPASLTGNFDQWAGISSPDYELADNRTGGSGASKPVLSLRQLVKLLEPTVTRTWELSDDLLAARQLALLLQNAETQRQREEAERLYEEQLARLRAEEAHVLYGNLVSQQTPRSWTVTENAVPYEIPFKNLIMWQFPNVNDTYSNNRVTWDLRSEGFLPSEGNKGHYAIVTNGTLQYYLHIEDDGHEVDRTNNAQLVSRGPNACSDSGWIEIWRLPNDTFSNQKSAIGLSGPVLNQFRPKVEILYFVPRTIDIAGDYYKAGHTVVDPRPVVLDAPRTFGQQLPTLVAPLPRDFLSFGTQYILRSSVTDINRPLTESVYSSRFNFGDSVRGFLATESVTGHTDELPTPEFASSLATNHRCFEQLLALHEHG